MDISAVQTSIYSRHSHITSEEASNGRRDDGSAFRSEWEEEEGDDTFGMRDAATEMKYIT